MSWFLIPVLSLWVNTVVVDYWHLSRDFSIGDTPIVCNDPYDHLYFCISRSFVGFIGVVYCLMSPTAELGDD